MSQKPTPRETKKVPPKEQLRRFYKGSRRRCINGWKKTETFIQEKRNVPVLTPSPSNEHAVQTQGPVVEDIFDNVFTALDVLDTKQNSLNNSLVQNHSKLKIEHRLLEADHIELKKKYNELEERLQKIEEILDNPYYGLI